jgi:hypothetical protein
MKSCFENIKVGDKIYISMLYGNFWHGLNNVPPTHTSIWNVVGFNYDYSPWLPYVSPEIAGGDWWLLTTQWHESIVRIKKYLQK